MSFLKTILEANDIRARYGSSLFKGAFTLSVNSLAYILNKPMPRGPLFVAFDVTFRCNSRCSYCDRWKVKNKEKELSTEEAKRLIKDLGKTGVWLLSFNGGEPLLRQDIFELIKEAKRRGLMTDINTNGSLLKQKAKLLVESGIDVISVSVESNKPEEHDSIRHFPNSFKLLNEGIEEIKKIRGNRKKPTIKVRMNIGKSTYQILEEYIQYWQSKGVDEIVIQPIHECTSNYLKVPQKMKFSQKDKEKFEAYFNSITKKYKWLDLAFYREFPNFFFNKEELHRKYACFAGSFFAQVDPYGNVYPCVQYIMNVGNLRKKGFKEIWNDEPMTRIRKIMRERRNQCLCWYNCNGTPNCYLTKMLGPFIKKSRKS